MTQIETAIFTELRSNPRACHSRRVQWYGTAVLILFLFGCGGTEEKRSEFIPDIPVECTSGQAADCAGNNLPVFVGIIESTGGSDCDDFLTGLNSATRQRTFVASGNTTSARRGVFLTANVSDWTDSFGGPIDTLTPGDYLVCAFVDTNRNDRIDTNEPVGSGVIRAGDVSFILDNWSAAYN